MKFIKIYKKLLKKELETLTAQLSSIQKEIEKTERKIHSITKEIEEKTNLTPENLLEVAVKHNYIKHLRKRKEKLCEQLKELVQKEEQIKSKVSLCKSKLKLLEKTEKNIKIENEKREDLLLERFVNEVLGHSNRSNL